MHVLAILALVGWIFGFAWTILNLLFLPRLRAGASVRGPLVSVIIPARNEARTIEASLRAWLAQLYQDLEIIVVNDRSTDETAAILARLAAANPRLVVLTGEDTPVGWLGKPWALQQGSRRARGELLLFVDADVIYAPGAVAAAVGAIEHTRSQLLTLFPYMEMVGFWENVSMPALALMTHTIMPTFLSNRTRSPSMALGGGTGNLVRQAAYEAAGRHEALKDAIVDDIGLARLIRRRGGSTFVVRADDFVRLRMYHGGREVAEGFTKNLFSAMGRNYVVVLLWLAVMVIGSLLPYPLAILGDGTSLVTVALITVTLVLLFWSLRYRPVYALAYPMMTLFWCYVLLRSVWITGIRGRVVWRGRTYDAGRVTSGM